MQVKKDLNEEKKTYIPVYFSPKFFSADWLF